MGILRQEISNPGRGREHLLEVVQDDERPALPEVRREPLQEAWALHILKAHDRRQRRGHASEKVTACTFGGPNLDELFITTSREGLEPGEDQLAGPLFRAEVSVAGLPVREFAG